MACREAAAVVETVRIGLRREVRCRLQAEEAGRSRRRRTVVASAVVVVAADVVVLFVVDAVGVAAPARRVVPR